MIRITAIKDIDENIFNYLKDNLSKPLENNKNVTTESLSLLCHLPWDKAKVYIDRFYKEYGHIEIMDSFEKLSGKDVIFNDNDDYSFITIILIDILYFWEILNRINSIHPILYIKFYTKYAPCRCSKFDAVRDFLYRHLRIRAYFPHFDFTFVFYNSTRDKIIFDRISLPLLGNSSLDRFTNFDTYIKLYIKNTCKYFDSIIDNDILNRTGEFDSESNRMDFIVDNLDKFNKFGLNNVNLLIISVKNVLYDTIYTRDLSSIGQTKSVYSYDMETYIDKYIRRGYRNLIEYKRDKSILCMLSRETVDISVERCNGNDNYFDYIRATLYITVGDGFDAQSKYIQANKDNLAKFVLNKIKESKKFQKLNVPITILELSDVIFTRQFLLIYTFGIKKELLALQEEQAEG